MRVGKHQLVNNERVPFWVISYLQDRYKALERHLQNRYGNEFDISIDFSSQSESAYLTIQEHYVPGEFSDSYEISFRNHDNFADGQYDKAIFLSHYGSWTDCKNDFINNVMPNILNKLRGAKAC